MPSTFSFGLVAITVSFSRLSLLALLLTKIVDCRLASREGGKNISNVVILPFPSHNEFDLFVNRTQYDYHSEHPHASTTVYISRTDYPWFLENNVVRHGHLEKTSNQARRYGCDIAATNGGPYNEDGTSSGSLVLQGKHYHNNKNHTNLAGFGTTTNQEWVFGNYFDILGTSDTTLWDFVTGFEWLVQDSQVVQNKVNPTGAVRAARTAVGVDTDGNLLLLVSDGYEKWYRYVKTKIVSWAIVQMSHYWLTILSFLHYRI